MPLNYWNIYLKFQGVLSVNNLCQRGLADKNVWKPLLQAIYMNCKSVNALFYLLFDTTVFLIAHTRDLLYFNNFFLLMDYVLAKSSWFKRGVGLCGACKLMCMPLREVSFSGSEQWWYNIAL